ncbi:MAG: hypothetical protein JAZ19_21230 [Candidatus Thiodiazotropha taylori]|nr:hypothetical protein [Candidatus Thiodiazotropha taylori]
MSSQQRVKSRKYRLEVSRRVLNGKRDYYWIILAWVFVVAYALYVNSITIVFPPLLITLFILITDSARPALIAELVLQNGVVSVYNKGAILWSTPQDEITSIELEKKGIFQLGSSRAIIIRTVKNDSYYQSLDGVGLKDSEIKQMIGEILPH